MRTDRTWREGPRNLAVRWLKYHDSIADAMADLGRAEDIGRVFTDFQKYLYQRQAAA